MIPVKLHSQKSGWLGIKEINSSQFALIFLL